MDDRLTFRAATIFGIFTVGWCLTGHLTAEDVTPLPDGTRHDLRYKLSTGDVLRYNVDHRVAIRNTIDDVTQEVHAKTESLKAWKVTDVLPNGDIEFMNVVERVRMQNHLPDRAPLDYDSQRDKTPPPGFEDAARAIGVPLSVVRMTPRGKVVSYNVKHKQLPAERDAQFVIRLPHEPVEIGAVWDEPLEVTVALDEGATKSIQARRHFKLANVANGVAVIEVDFQVLSPIDPQIESKLVDRLMKGTVRFDIEKGRVIGQTCEVDKRILGFAGPTSSLHYVMRMEETLTDDTKSIAAGKNTSSPEKSARRPTNSRRPPSRTATRNNFGKAAHR